MIRVVQSSSVWLPQTQTWIHTQVSSLPADRIESHVVCEKPANLAQFPVLHLHDFSAAGLLERIWDRGARRLRVRRHLGYLARVARGVDAAIIHSHFGDVAWRDLGAVRAAHCRQVVTFYGHDMSLLPQSRRWRTRFRELFRNVDLVLCEGPHMAREVVGLGCPESRMRIQHLGIPLERLPFAPRQWSPGRKLKVLIAASFTEKKGIPYAIHALGMLRQHVDLEITVIGDARAGRAEDLAEKHKILAAVAAQGLGDKVRLLGYQPYAAFLEEAYRHHVFLAPSVTAQDGDTEGGAPVSIVEMAASGMLIVSTHHCDIPEVVRDGETGFLAPERDVRRLAERLVEAVRQPERWSNMLAAGRSHVQAQFNASTQGQRLADHYEALVRDVRRNDTAVA